MPTCTPRKLSDALLLAGSALVLTLLLGTPAIVQSDPYLAEDEAVSWSDPAEPDLFAKATELGDAVAIYEFVRNEYDFDLHQGAWASSVHTFHAKRGSDVDLASLLIAMLRSQGIPSRYVTGVTRISTLNLALWTRTPNAYSGALQLARLGARDLVFNPSTLSTIRRVWVEALLPVENYRGVGAASTINCQVEAAKCTWVALDPAYKLYIPLNLETVVDVSAAVQFDFDAYYHAEDSDYSAPDSLDRARKDPLEIYEEQILEYLRSTPGLEGKTLEDCRYDWQLEKEELGVLPASLPYEVVPVPVPVPYGSISAFDAENESAPWSQTIEFEVSFPEIDELAGVAVSSGDDPVSMVELSTGEMAMFFESDDFSNPSAERRLVLVRTGKPDLVLMTITPSGYTTHDGQGGSVGSGTLNEATAVDILLTATVNNGAEGTKVTYPKLYSGERLGGIFLIAAGSDVSHGSQFRRASEALRQAAESYPTDLTAGGEVFVDEDGDGQQGPGEKLLLEHSQANRALTGGVLAAARALYHMRVTERSDRAADYMRVRAADVVQVGLLSTQHAVTRLAGSPIAVTPIGLLIDVKNSRTALALFDYPFDGSNQFFRLDGHIFSSMEHEVWRELTGIDATSTMSGFQSLTHEGALLHTVDGSATPLLHAAIQNLGFSPGMPQGFKNRKIELFDMKIFFPHLSGNGDPEVLQVMKEGVVASSPEIDFATWSLLLDNAGSGYEIFFSSYKPLHDELKSHIASGVTYDPPENLSCNPAVYSESPTVLYGVLEDCMWDAIAGDEGEPFRDYLAYFDQFDGFDQQEHLFRHYQPVDELHFPFPQIVQMRDEIVRGLANPAREAQWMVPTEVAQAPLGNFAVWIRRELEGGYAPEHEKRSEYAINRASGGYISNDVPELPEDPLNPFYDYEYFCEECLAEDINNSYVAGSTDDPIATATGNLFHDETDLRIRGRGLDYLFTRTYNSKSASTQPEGLPIGLGWSHSYALRLVARDKNIPSLPSQAEDTIVSSLVFIDERGNESIFGAQGFTSGLETRTVINPTGNFAELDLSQAPANVYTLTFPNGVVYEFGGTDLEVVGAVAKIQAIRDPYGNELTFTYSMGATGNLIGISDGLDSVGRPGLVLSYDANNRLDQISDWTGRTWDYDYEGDKLRFVTNPLNETTEYQYDPRNGLLSAIILPEDRDADGEGDVRTDFTYYENDRAFTNANSYGHGETVDYDFFRRRSRFSDPRGFVHSHYHDERGGMTKLVEPDGAVVLFTNNADGDRDSKVNGLGHATNYSYCTARTLDGCASDTSGMVTREQDAHLNTTDYTYGVHAQLTSVVDKRGYQATSDYYGLDDPVSGALAGKLERTSAELDGAMVELAHYSYEPGGAVRDLVERRDAGPNDQRVTIHQYDPTGLELEHRTVTGAGITEPITWDFGYDDLSRVVEETLNRRASPSNPVLLQLTTEYQYDDLDRLTHVTDALGNQREVVFDKNGKVREVRMHYPLPGSSVDTRVIETNFYDDADRLIETRDVLGISTFFEYDSGGKLLKVINGLGHATKFEYDEVGRRTAVIDANGFRTETRYDLAGRPIELENANGEITKLAYDALGRRTSIIDPNQFETKLDYDPNGNLTHQTDANALAGLAGKNSYDASVYMEYDELGRLERTIDAMDGETVFEYDLLGNRTKLIDAKGQMTEFRYDNLGRLIEVLDPIVEQPIDKTTRYEYDQAGNVYEKTDRIGRVTQYTYDELNRLVQIDYLVDGTSEFIEYDSYGNVKTRSNPHVTYTYEYDIANRLTKRIDSRTGQFLEYFYDVLGNVTRKIDYEGEVTHYRYDPAGRLVGMESQGQLQVSYHYDPAGRLLNRIQSNGSQTDYAYDDAGRLEKLVHKNALGQVISSTDYLRDRVGNITHKTDADGTITFGYDDRYQLTSAGGPAAYGVYSYDYDEVGNRKTGWVHDANNRLLSVITPELDYRFEYDSEGNLRVQRDPNGIAVKIFDWDQKNQLRSVRMGVGPSAPKYHCKYDPLGYRIEKEGADGVRRYMLEGEHVESVYDGRGQLREKYLRGVVIDEIVAARLYSASQTLQSLTFHHDELQSLVAATNHFGYVDSLAQYAPFGQIVGGDSSWLTPIGYTGREADVESGLYYYRARYYDPTTGRFLSEDPLGFGGGINFYRYAGNRPTAATDPSGMESTLHFTVQGWSGAGVGVRDQGAFAVGTSLVFDDSWNVGLVNVYTMSTVIGGGVELQGVIGATTQRDIFAAYDSSQVTTAGAALSVPTVGLPTLSAGGELLMDADGNIVGAESVFGLGISTPTAQLGIQHAELVASFNIVDDLLTSVASFVYNGEGYSDEEYAPNLAVYRK